MAHSFVVSFVAMIIRQQMVIQLPQRGPHQFDGSRAFVMPIRKKPSWEHKLVKPPFITLWANGDISICFNVVWEYRTRAIRCYGYNQAGKLIVKEFAKVEWDFYLEHRHMRILSEIETEGFMDAIKDIYEGVRGITAK